MSTTYIKMSEAFGKEVLWKGECTSNQIFGESVFRQFQAAEPVAIPRLVALKRIKDILRRHFTGKFQLLSVMVKDPFIKVVVKIDCKYRSVTVTEGIDWSYVNTCTNSSVLRILDNIEKGTAKYKIWIPLPEEVKEDLECEDIVRRL
jgi:hypothetical protein